MKLVLDSCPKTSIYPFLRPSFHLDALLECLCDNEMRLPATLPLETNEKHSLLLFRYLTIAVPPRHPYAPPFQDEHPWSSLPSCPPALFKTVYKCGTHNLCQFFSEMGLCPPWKEKTLHLCIPVLCFGLRAFFNGMLNGLCSTLYWNQEIWKQQPCGPLSPYPSVSFVLELEWRLGPLPRKEK